MADQAPSVTVCIPTFNQAAFLERAIASAASQNYPRIEILVSDDASTDDTPVVLGRLALQYANLRWYRQPKNLNIAANNTWLMSQVTSDYTVRLDSDDMIEPDFVMSLVELMEAHPSAGYGHAAVQIIDQHDRELYVVRLNRKSGFIDHETALKESIWAYRVAANVCIFRTKALERLDFFRGRPDFVEDYDLSVRMADMGFGNVYIDRVLARYRLWTDVRSVRARRKIMQLNGFLRIFEESILPAYRRRAWDTRDVTRARRALALRHADGCFSKTFSRDEQLELTKLIKQLAGGETLQLRIRFALFRLGFGRLVQTQYLINRESRRIAKNALSRLRSLQKN